MNIDIIKTYVNEYKLNVLPTKPKEKAPAGASWKEYQERFITDSEIIEKFGDVDLEAIKIGVVCGKISGNLEALDFDNKMNNAEEIFKQFSEIPCIREIINKCPIEKSQNGGFHVYYRCERIEGNQKLASWPNGLDDKGKEKRECLIETRAEGGYCVCAPSKGYDMFQGDFGGIPVVSPDEREDLLSAAKSFNKIEYKPVSIFSSSKKYSETPWSQYDSAPESIPEAKKLLKENGWALKYIRDEKEYWCRPGKKDGISATFKDDFYVYSSSASPFEPNTAYRPSGIYSLLKYGASEDSFKKAIKDFIQRGYGKSLTYSNDNIEAVENYLSEKYDFRINVVVNKLEMKGKGESEYREAEDYDISSIFREIQHKNINYSYEKLNNLLNSNFVPKYDPFIEYFSGLPEWDEHDYIKDLSQTIKLADESMRQFWYLCLRKHLIATAACATQPNITNETAITFFGKQGYGKTKWLNRLVPKALGADKYLYVGNINDDKDSKINLSTRLIINLDELGSLGKDEIGFLKSMFSLEKVSLREPYMRKSKTFIRRASFVGSIDREEFLADLSGTRRFLAFSVTELDYEHKIDMDRVYSQAFALFKQGERFYFNKNEIEEIEKNNEDFKVRSYEEGLLFDYFSKPNGDGGTLMSTTKIAEVFAENSSSYKISDASIRKIGQILAKYGFTKKSSKQNGVSNKCWLVHQKNSVPATPVFERISASEW